MNRQIIDRWFCRIDRSPVAISDGFATTIRRKAPVTPEVTPQVTPQVDRLLRVLHGEMTRGDLMATLTLRDRMRFSNEYLAPALNAGLIEMTIPDKPRSRLQKYRLTEKGKQVLDDTLIGPYMGQLGQEN
ncbi:MAG: Fic family protein [Pseudomonadota bacterium]